MKMKKFGRKRYIVQAKRRDTNEKWSDWTDTNNYRQAVNQARHVEEVGYLAKIVVKEKQVEELWDILGKNEHEKADAILDAGFRKQSEIAREIFEEIEKILNASQTELVGRKFYYRYIIDEHIAELKKQYMGESE
jgi:hypothetical protein